MLIQELNKNLPDQVRIFSDIFLLFSNASADNNVSF